MEKMREAGCYRIAFGVEVGTQEMLDRIGKHYTLDHFRKAFAITKEAGIEIIGFFLFLNVRWSPFRNFSPNR